jgi:hypothetical protein
MTHNEDLNKLIKLLISIFNYHYSAMYLVNISKNDFKVYYTIIILPSLFVDSFSPMSKLLSTKYIICKVKTHILFKRMILKYKISHLYILNI